MTFSITTLGVMSGTSADGLDLACCRFENTAGAWTFTVEAATTVPFDDAWRQRLTGAFHASGAETARLHADFGRYIGSQVNRFLEASGVKPEAISSHGHTLFHDPENGYTFQAGCGAAIAATTGIDTVCDFRTTDVALGGQGAPLVPIGDQLLFGGHRFCLNLGGIANISFDTRGKRVAFDICPANMALNYLAEKLGKPFDENGDIASEGSLIPGLYETLNRLDYYTRPIPKSLGREWFEHHFLPHISHPDYAVPDVLHTVTQHIAHQIATSVPVAAGTTMLVTGGGAFNGFLMDCLGDALSPTGVHPVIPDEGVVSYKEAIIFAFLGALRIRRIPNALSSATGASRDSVGGAIYAGSAQSIISQ